MSRETNEGVMMHFKKITMNLLKIVQPLVEPITSLAKPKAYLEAYFSIRQLPWKVTSSEPVISPSLLSFFFLCNILRSNRYWWGTVDNHVGRGKFLKLRSCLLYRLIGMKCITPWLWELLCWTVKSGFKIWQPLHLRLMASALSPSDKCRRLLGKESFLQRGVGYMAKGMCLIQSNKTNSYTANSFI